MAYKLSTRAFPLVAVLSLLSGAGATSLRGIVRDNTGMPLDSARVILLPVNREAVTDSTGAYTFDSLQAGDYRMRIVKRDHATSEFDIELSESDTVITTTLRSTLTELDRMTVVATASPSRLDELTRTVSVASEDELRRAHAQSLSDALGDMPGVQIAEQGPNVTKPVIRGMTNQRIVLVRDGVRHEAQQWSNHHTPEADIADAARIEVLRGPGSLLYGSGALGGVVFVKSPRILTTGDGAAPLGADLSYQYFTNSQQHAGRLGVHGAWASGAWRLDMSGRKADHFAVPGERHFLVKQAAGEVSDSVETQFPGFKQYNVRLLSGVSTERLELSLSGTHYWEEQTLIGEGHWHNSGGPDGGPWYHVGEPIRSPTLHQKLQLSGSVYAGDHTVDIDVAGQHDHRKGIPGSIGVQVDLESYHAAANARWRHDFHERAPGTIGVSVSHERDRTYGVEVLIPNHNTTDAGLFALQEARLAHGLKVQAGIRGDYRGYEIYRTHMTEGFVPVTDTDPTTAVPGDPPRIRGQLVDSIPSLVVEGRDGTLVPSFSLGLSWAPKRLPLSCAANLGTGFRVPEPNELAILGAHHGSYEYLVGLAIDDPTEGEVTITDIGALRETAWNTDLIARLATKRYDAELSLYYNHLSDYIYARPTGEFIWLSAISALPLKEYEQTDARFYGLEISNSLRPFDWLTLTAGYDIVIGEVLEGVDDVDGDGEIEPWLPGVQPPRLTGGLDWRIPVGLSWMNETVASLDVRGYFAQRRLAEFENVIRKDSDGANVEFESEGYVLVGVGVRTTIAAFGKEALLSARIDNLFNEEYTSHLSNYKGLAENPGFDLSVKVSVRL
ncbi:MAG: TonB-dependent receptor [Chitinivibrionales bacterium]|nr:TonB-dependent receptor [Chitinivibrionales bacterium]